MSSVVSKHALIIALGGFSIAALFVWYINKKDNDGRKKKKLEELVSNGTAKTRKEIERKEQNGNVSEVTSSKPVEDNVLKADIHVVTKNENPTIESSQSTEKQKKFEPSKEREETDHAASKESEEIPKEKEQMEKVQEAQVQPQSEKTEETKGDLVEVAKQENCIDEEPFVKKEEQKQKSTPTPITMPSKKKVLDNEQVKIPEEPTPTKVLETTCPLSLDITAQMSPASFSWSEEMEKSYNEEEFRTNESSDIDRSPASPLRHMQQNHIKRNQKIVRKGRVNGGRDHIQQQQHKEDKNQPIKKGQRRLTKEKSAEETPEKPQKRVVLNNENASGDVVHNKSIDVSPQRNCDNESYEKSDSPGLDSQNSEASSQDSGRATGPLTSPHDEGLTGTDDDFLPMYEFEIPNSLVGLIIGVKGKTIKELSTRTNVRMLIRQHHAPDKSKTHQICQVRGKRDEINHCLQMLRRRFPPARFPELNLQPVVPPVMPNNNFDMLSTQPTWLTLPENIKCEVGVSSIISASHFFIQQPTHPSFASLRHLDMYMGSLYGEQSNLPELPIPCQNGLLCAAPVANNWFRAVTVQYFEETDEVFVKFVDYGGYSKMARQDLRQIRTDLMSLPFQSTEVMLAHVRPIDGTSNWSDVAMAKFRELCTGKAITCKLVGYSTDTRIPMVELYLTVKDQEKTREVRFDQLLMESRLAKAADPSKMTRLSYPDTMGEVHIKRPSFSSQTSQTTSVC